MDEEFFKYIEILIIEFHDFLYLGNHFGNRVIYEIFEKILKNFTICHIHPNNFGATKLINNIEIPAILEFTFINNNLISQKKTISNNLPHTLDEKNNPENKDIILPKCFY